MAPILFLQLPLPLLFTIIIEDTKFINVWNTRGRHFFTG
jgi:hypothetical protein